MCYRNKTQTSSLTKHTLRCKAKPLPHTPGCYRLCSIREKVWVFCVKAHFVVTWQLMSNYKLIRLKKFVSYKIVKLCNWLFFQIYLILYTCVWRCDVTGTPENFLGALYARRTGIITLLLRFKVTRFTSCFHIHDEIFTLPYKIKGRVNFNSATFVTCQRFKSTSSSEFNSLVETPSVTCLTDFFF